MQYLVEYKDRISCSAEDGMSDEVGMCSLKEFESDSNSSETPSEIGSCVANEMCSSKNDSLFARQETVAGEDRHCPKLPDTFSRLQNNSCLKCKSSSELCQTDSRPLGIPSAGLHGLTSIVLAYSSSDESEAENEDEDETVNDHKTPAVSQCDSLICSGACLSNSQRGSSSFVIADSAETFHSSFALLENVSETPRIHTSNLNNSALTEHQGISSNQPDGDSNLILGDQCSSSSTELRILPSSDRNTEIFITKESHIEGSVTSPTAVQSELLDKVMTMLIRLRLSVKRLSSGGHFPYSAVPLISLMENVEKCYDGC